MELKYTQTNLTFSSCLLAVALALGACGDEKSSGDDDNKAEEDDDKGASKADSGSKAPDSGSKPAGDGGIKPTDGGFKPTDDGSKSDAGKTEADPGSSSGETGNTIYAGGPACPTIGRKISGTVDGHEISYNLSTISEGDDTYFEASESSSDTGLLRLEWSPAIDSSGKPAKIDDGELRLPSTYDFGPYCVIEGKAQRDSKLDEDDGYREFYTITKVKAKSEGSCTGPVLEADLKVCTNYR